MNHERNMAFRLLGDLYVVRHNMMPPGDSEWNAYLESLRRADPPKTRSLVVTAGGVADAEQRARFDKLLSGRTTTISVISESTWVRLIVKAMSWNNPSIRIFSPSEIDHAYCHVWMSSKEIELAERELAKMWHEIDA